LHIIDTIRARNALLSINQTSGMLLRLLDEPRELQPDEARALVRAAGDLTSLVNMLGMALTESDGKLPDTLDTNPKVVPATVDTLRDAVLRAADAQHQHEAAE
jgi:hypothetical protein